MCNAESVRDLLLQKKFLTFRRSFCGSFIVSREPMVRSFLPNVNLTLGGSSVDAFLTVPSGF